MKKIPWFPLNTHPARVGIYRIRCAGATKQFWCKWMGTKWTAGFRHRRDAESDMSPGGVQAKAWRGIAKGTEK